MLNIIIPIILIVVSLILAIYIVSTKNIKIIASIQSQKVPKELVGKVAVYFSISLILATISIALGIYLIETNLLLGLSLIVLAIVILIPFYSYYQRIQK
ncbi:TPA: hypothetical protein I1641_001641 [Staphylococcus pseudintermedius]|nr:hypothetical protein [Staphylococcus pseudintermedius]EJA1938816.1 hypothetical protein [Staphylococcus pseudintermedius]EJG0090800.1 hypothetical protein [Staphylococcus pseudintermedius]HAR6042911.1 hypothetical protein [Staphylococcus pseudintermedius]